jgi:hypothetical protein
VIGVRFACVSGGVVERQFRAPLELGVECGVTERVAG